ncbi:MAG: YidC/Oxa1 family membrane protein insertase [Clostridia bacterium]|nr:YidC/Oxa1 family membrane protein insertase [Clostridia bacterium]
MDIIMTLAVALPSNLIGKWLVQLSELLPSFGVTVIVFTIILKLITSPLDIWQRISQRKQSRAMARLQPKLAKLQKQYANQPQLLRQKQAELQKEEKLHPLASCLPLIVTMVIFFVVFAGFRQLVAYQNEVIMENVYTEYVQFIADESGENVETAVKDYVISAHRNKLMSDTPEGADINQDALDNAMNEYVLQIENKSGAGYEDYTSALQIYRTYFDIEGVGDKKTYYDSLSKSDKEIVIGSGNAFESNLNVCLANAYEEHMESFLWIKNIFMSDTGTNVVPTVQQFTGGKIQAKWNVAVSYDTLTSPAQQRLNKKSFWDAKNWNGYFVLPILSVALSFLTTWFTQKMSPQNVMGDAKQQKSQQRTMKMVTYMMPLIMGIFAIVYSAAFGLYYFMSNAISTLFNVAFLIITKQLDKREAAKSLLIK